MLRYNSNYADIIELKHYWNKYTRDVTAISPRRIELASFSFFSFSFSFFSRNENVTKSEIHYLKQKAKYDGDATVFR